MGLLSPQGLRTDSAWGTPSPPDTYVCLHLTQGRGSMTPSSRLLLLHYRTDPHFALISTEHALWLTYLIHCLGLSSGCLHPERSLLRELCPPAVSTTQVNCPAGPDSSCPSLLWSTGGVWVWFWFLGDKSSGFSEYGECRSLSGLVPGLHLCCP